MKKYLKFLAYAIKEQRSYKINFITSIFVMLFNDSCFIVIFLIFLWYFTNTGLTLWNFLILFSASCFWYWLTHWLLYNISGLPDIIETGKMDYYLSFPTNPLSFLLTTKFDITNVWDMVFGLICLCIYAFIYSNEAAGIVIIKWLLLLILSWIAVTWIYIMIWSLSFRIQKWSKVADLFNSMFTSFSQYPPEIYEHNKIVYIFMCILLYPWFILPYKILLENNWIAPWMLLITLSFLTLFLWIFVFQRWLKRYSSWNLVHQM